MESIWHAIRDGAPFSFINVAVLAIVLAIIAERFVYILTKYRVNSREFMAQIRRRTRGCYWARCCWPELWSSSLVGSCPRSHPWAERDSAEFLTCWTEPL